MAIRQEVFNFIGPHVQWWRAPAGVTQARFEAWGAAGAMGSGVHFQNQTYVAGGSGLPCQNFTNSPNNRALGYNYANSAGYAAGTILVTPGTYYYVAVGGNGQPGFSRVHPDGVVYTGDFSGGAGGWPDGGKGGRGWLATQNLYNAAAPITMNFTTSGSVPSATAVNQYWLRTDHNIVYVSTGTGTTHWKQVTRQHNPFAGGSGGGGGGSTSWMTDDALGQSTRILIAGGSGGAGGVQVTDGAGAWQVGVSAQDGTAPIPPFGTENTQNLPGPTETVWSTVVDYFTSGVGVGGTGGFTSPINAPTQNVDSSQPAGSFGTPGANGGPATGQHVYGLDQGHIPTTSGGGGGGTPQSGGIAGVTAGQHTATGATAGDTNVNALDPNGALTFGTGGNGADGKANTFDTDWCTGGGGGGGGFHGGGGGGQGYYGGPFTYGGGGGAGSNFAQNIFTNVVLTGGARPPAPAPSAPDASLGAGGLGGFARVTYHYPPSVAWNAMSAAFDVTQPLYCQFRYNTAGKDVYSFDIGYSVSLGATVPDAYTTVLVDADSLVPGNTLAGTTHLFYNFPANFFTVNTQYVLFVRATDMDGKPGIPDPVQGLPNADTSPWVRSDPVIAEAHSVFAPLVITSPAPLPGFTATVPPGTIPLTWTVPVGPLLGYKAVILDPNGNQIATTNWQPGGSRVNLAVDPGFTATSGANQWSTNSGTYTGADTTAPGVSGKNGKIVWTANSTGNASALSPQFVYKQGGSGYRVMLQVASSVANDAQPVWVAVLDSQQNMIASQPVSFAAVGANTRIPVDFTFSLPGDKTAFYVALIPSDGATMGNADGTRTHYVSDLLAEPNVNYATPGTYFDGGHANGNTGTAAWTGTANASPSSLTNANVVSDSTNLQEAAVINGCTLKIYSMTLAGGIYGYTAVVSEALNINHTQPPVPIVFMQIDNIAGFISFEINANDVGATYPAAAFDVYRIDTRTGDTIRVGVNIKPDPVTRLGYFQDVPADGQQVAYEILSISAAGGYSPATQGTVSTNG
ncbi:MAG: hypothetical protein ACM3UO_00160 [Bacillota bacterium]